MLFTSESVTSGHPDKICDYISDTVLDACLREDPQSKVAVDTWVKDNKVGLIGELTTGATLDFEQLVRNAIHAVGYTDSQLGFHHETCDLYVHIGEQSQEINKAVVKDQKEIGAGDQGLMFGMACTQTEALLPMPIFLAHTLAEQLETTRKKKEKKKDYTLRPDGKTQVTIAYEDDNVTVKSIDTILISTQHDQAVSNEKLKDILVEEVIKPVIKRHNLSKYYKNPKLLINPSGSFVLGGPVADSGMTGRKIVVDGYGGWGRVGGGAFSGKDSTKIDRSGAYMARYLAKQVVAKGWAEECEIQLSYAIGKAEPVSITVFGNTSKSKEFIGKHIADSYDLRPRAIIEFLGLDKPIFVPTSRYGHFGRNSKGDLFTWEKIA
jgi:S-adenosylmethionine synthetase